MTVAGTTTIVCVRHGQTDWNVAGRWQGHINMPLNDTGQEQARRVAERLRSWPFAALYSSDLKRAAGTAAIIGARLGLEPIFDRDWRERHVGDLGGLTNADIADQFPNLWASLQRDELEPPNGETWAQLHSRVTRALDHILAHHTGEMVGVVSHGGIIRVLIGHVLGLPPGRNPAVSLRGNTGITIIEARDEQLLLSRLNDTAHLEID